MENAARAEERTAVFGYGSLINPKSVAKTLGRTLSADEMVACRLRGYRREWEAVDTVWVREAAPVHAVFLNLRPDPSSEAIGVGFYVRAAELRALDKRERHYDRVDVSRLLRPRLQGTVYTYIAKPERLVADREVCVMTGYEELIRDGLEYWGPEFAAEFHRTTSPHRFPRFAGPYSFSGPRG